MSLKKQYTKLMQRDFLVKMLADQAMILMFMYIQEQELTSAARKLDLLNLLKENKESQE